MAVDWNECVTNNPPYAACAACLWRHQRGIRCAAVRLVSPCISGASCSTTWSILCSPACGSLDHVISIKAVRGLWIFKTCNRLGGLGGGGGRGGGADLNGFASSFSRVESASQRRGHWLRVRIWNLLCFPSLVCLSLSFAYFYVSPYACGVLASSISSPQRNVIASLRNSLWCQCAMAVKKHTVKRRRGRGEGRGFSLVLGGNGWKSVLLDSWPNLTDWVDLVLVCWFGLGTFTLLVSYTACILHAGLVGVRGGGGGWGGGGAEYYYQRTGLTLSTRRTAQKTILPRMES